MEIPKTVTQGSNTYNVNEIGAGAFKNMTNITSAAFWNGDLDLIVGKEAFSGCTYLTYFDLWGKSTVIGDSAFVNAATESSKYGFSFDAGEEGDCVTYIGNNAFEGVRFGGFTIGAGETTIGKNALGAEVK